MICDSRRGELESIAALGLALQRAPNSELSVEESAKNIRDNVVMVFRSKTIEPNRDSTLPGQFNYSIDRGGSGLRITADGFVLTAAHIIESWIDDWKVLEEKWNGCPTRSEFFETVLASAYPYWIVRKEDDKILTSPLDFTCYARDKNYDVAVIKAVTAREPSPLQFKLAERVAVFEDLQMLTLNTADCSLSTKSGIVTPDPRTPVVGYNIKREGRIILDPMRTTIPVRGGDSGGPIINRDGSLVGLVSGSSNPDLHLKSNPAAEGVAYCSRITYVLSLARQLEGYLKQKRGRG